jgi:hypothetical protein
MIGQQNELVRKLREHRPQILEKKERVSFDMMDQIPVGLKIG